MSRFTHGLGLAMFCTASHGCDLTTAPTSTPPEASAAAAADPISGLLGDQAPSLCEQGVVNHQGVQAVQAAQVPASADVPRALELQSHGATSCARLSSGVVRCWGSNAGGRLGSCGPESFAALPVAFTGVREAKALGLGRLGTCVVETSGQLMCSAGVRERLAAQGVGRIAGVERAVAVAVGDQHVCVLGGDGRVLCFGHWSADEMLGPRADMVAQGQDEGRAAGWVDVPAAHQLVAGSQHTCALDRQGQVMCWGRNLHGQLGVAPDSVLEENRGTARRIAGLAFVSKLVAADNTTCGLSDDGQVMCWGGDFPPQPVAIDLPAAQDVALGQRVVCVASRRGKLACVAKDPRWLQPQRGVELAGFDDVVGVAAGQEVVCALHGDGAVHCRGAASLGQLGTGTAGTGATAGRFVLLGGVPL